MPPPRHAVVIGGSLAGLCAARVLADHVENVTVVDRDDFPAEPAVRKGLPQAHHLHVLIPAGQNALDRLFPGVIAALHERGAVPVAAVELRDPVTPDELLDHVATVLAPYEVPTEIRIVAALPRTESGKVALPTIAELFDGSGAQPHGGEEPAWT